MCDGFAVCFCWDGAHIFYCVAPCVSILWHLVCLLFTRVRLFCSLIFCVSFVHTLCPPPQCSGKTDNLGISAVSFSESPVVPGSTLTITVDATPTVAVTAGADLTFNIKLGAFSIFSVTKDFCADLGLTCPLPAGVPVTATVAVEVKSSAPAASVTAEVSAKNGDGSALTCVDIPMTISSNFEELPLTIHPELELTESLVSSYFGSFKAKYNKVYDHAEEEATRLGHFKASLLRAQSRNADLTEHNFGVTKFSDMSVEEFKATMLTYKAGDRPAVTSTMTATARQLRGAAFAATDKDWMADGAVTAVKDQGQCGSCWAFSTAEQIESAYFMQGGDLTEFSPKQIVQCDTGGDDAGCRGGDTITAYDYVTKAGGLALEKDYPYSGAVTHGLTGKCMDSFDVHPGTSVASWKYATKECTSKKCDSQDEDTLAENLNTEGPASICVDAEPWQDYTNGVMKEKSCANGYDDLDHCVQLIGFSGLGGANPYWIVRNSWTADWGVDGMIHLEYGANTCGVADEATFVTLE